MGLISKTGLVLLVIGMILITCLVDMTIGLIILSKLLPSSATKENDESLVLVSFSPSKTIVNSLNSNICLFDKSTKVILPEKIVGANKFLIYVDLETNTETKIPLPQKRDLSFFIPVNDKCIVEILPDKRNTHTTNYVIDRNGKLSDVESLDLNIYQEGEDITMTPSYRRFRELLEDKQIEDLTEIIQIAYDGNKNPSRYYQGFYSQNAIFYVNGEYNRKVYNKLLEFKTDTAIVDYTNLNTHLSYKDLEIELQRREFIKFAGSVSNENIMHLTIRKGNDTIKDISLNDLYYYARIIDGRLYLLGRSIRYIDLEKL